MQNQIIKSIEFVSQSCTNFQNMEEATCVMKVFPFNKITLAT